MFIDEQLVFTAFLDSKEKEKILETINILTNIRDTMKKNNCNAINTERDEENPNYININSIINIISTLYAINNMHTIERLKD